MPQLIFFYGLLKIHIQNKCKQLTSESPLHDWLSALDEMHLLCVLCVLPRVLCGAFFHHKEHKEDHKMHKASYHEISAFPVIYFIRQFFLSHFNEIFAI